MSYPTFRSNWILAGFSDSPQSTPARSSAISSGNMKGRAGNPLALTLKRLQPCHDLD